MLPSTFKELTEIFNESYVLHVKFTKDVENDMTYAEENMLATITKISLQKEIKDGQEETCMVKCDYSKYRPHNKSLESPTYYLNTSLIPNALGTATEAGEYSDTEVLLINASHDPNKYFSVLEENSLVNNYLKYREDKETYVQWLERCMIKLKVVNKLYGK